MLVAIAEFERELIEKRTGDMGKKGITKLAREHDSLQFADPAILDRFLPSLTPVAQVLELRRLLCDWKSRARRITASRWRRTMLRRQASRSEPRMNFAPNVLWWRSAQRSNPAHAAGRSALARDIDGSASAWTRTSPWETSKFAGSGERARQGRPVG